MRFYEFESKQLFGKHGIPLPTGSRVAHSREEAVAIAAASSCECATRDPVGSGMPCLPNSCFDSNS